MTNLGQFIPDPAAQAAPQAATPSPAVDVQTLAPMQVTPDSLQPGQPHPAQSGGVTGGTGTPSGAWDGSMQGNWSFPNGK